MLQNAWPRATVLIAIAIVAALLQGRATAAGSGGYTVQRFPASGTCHVSGTGLYVLPDQHCTPGALNQDVSQATIGTTICRSGWTKTIRPPESITAREKRAAISAYGHYAGRRLRTYELDHLIPLSLGGAPNAAANLWPQPDYPSVIAGSRSYYLNPKDRLESRLHSLTCKGRLTLREAQRAIATDWVAAYHRYVR
jgi:hypothetical protein